MILIFDLDDTLYPEITYVYSGFKAVSEFIARKYGIQYNYINNKLKKLLNENGRGEIFDDMLKQIDKYSKGKVKQCLNIYHSHKPNIKLYNDSIDCFKKYKNIKKYIITDGNKIVQRNKIKALNLNKYIDRVIISHQYGIIYTKPSSYLFQKVSDWEEVPYNEITYIGDDPYKDFAGIKTLGFKTIRVNRGKYKNIILDKKFEANILINNLNELNI